MCLGDGDERPSIVSVTRPFTTKSMISNGSEMAVQGSVVRVTEIARDKSTPEKNEYSEK